MITQFARTEKIIGSQGIKHLQSARVILFGLGGVGSYVAEALVRSGIGHMTLVDKDVVDETNLNRQLIALHTTIGEEKVAVAAARYREINPAVDVQALSACVLPENIQTFGLENYDYAIDAVDMVTAKLAIIEECHRKGTPVISCMGTGNKMDPSRFEVAMIEKTSVCPLAKVMRRELKLRGIKKVKVVYSREEPSVKITPPGSMSFVPGAAGLLIAATVVKDLLGINVSPN